MVPADHFRADQLGGRAAQRRSGGASVLSNQPEMRVSHDWARDHRLTERELEIVRLICQGMKNGAMARRLGLATPTIRFHLRNLHKKLDTSDKVDIVLKVWRSELKMSLDICLPKLALVSQYHLTDREVQVVALICKGMKNGSIAEMLGLAMPTVRFHLRNVHKKLKTSDKVDIVLHAWRAATL